MLETNVNTLKRKQMANILQTTFKMHFLDVESVNYHWYMLKRATTSLSLWRIYASPVINEFTYIHAVETAKNLSWSTMMVTFGTSIPLPALPFTCTRTIWVLRISHHNHAFENIVGIIRAISSQRIGVKYELYQWWRKLVMFTLLFLYSNKRRLDVFQTLRRSVGSGSLCCMTYNPNAAEQAIST